MTTTIHLAQQPEADELLGRSPLRRVGGDGRWTSRSPWNGRSPGRATIAQRMGSDDLRRARGSPPTTPEAFAAILSDKPAVHRYPGSMAKRVQQLCQYLVEHYDGDAAAVWKDAKTGAELFKRLTDLPGYGEQKAKIFTALLGKQYGVKPKGWREAAGAYGADGSCMSVADITGPDSLQKVRAHKQEMKRAAKEAKTAKTAKTSQAKK
ncbi:HhH-GPD-type base excision DNA repair protein [Yinghuangia aomiensis]